MNVNNLAIINKSYRKNLLLSLLNEIKIAQNNRTKDVYISEELKDELRENLSSLESLIFYIAFGVSVLCNFLMPNIVSYIFVGLLYFIYLLEHPFTHILRLYFDGANFNQILVMYDRVFAHIFKIRYVLILPIIFTLFYYFSNYSLVLDFSFIFNFLEGYNIKFQHNDKILFNTPIFQLYVSDIFYFLEFILYKILNAINNCVIYCSLMISYLFFVTKVAQFFKVPR